MTAAGGTRRLVKFYEQMSSLDMILGSLAAERVDMERLQARDVYTRGLDCQNLGTFSMLDVLAGVLEEYGAPGPKDKLLDIGCGLGGPGRFLVDRFGCSIVGTDLLTKRIEIAKAGYIETLANLDGRTGILAARRVGPEPRRRRRRTRAR